ncbi:hypothetical protein [Legionella tunisiensis]|uniref:hypothetical protein n=1 Tax=Legionella tunisiensis TaxID=1034944 RepID=UPI0002EE013D|nr:hypothetical protein [Legionella tunisiensis]
MGNDKAAPLDLASFDNLLESSLTESEVITQQPDTSSLVINNSLDKDPPFA